MWDQLVKVLGVGVTVEVGLQGLNFFVGIYVHPILFAVELPINW
jgi:hypothetical protein